MTHRELREQGWAGARRWMAWILFLAIAAQLTATAKPKFRSSDLEAPSSEIFFCDLDGDGLKDAVTVDGVTLLVFFQGPQGQFRKEPQHRITLEDRPCLMWPAPLGGNAERLLVMTSEGVDAWDCSRDGAPVCDHLIRQKTILPATVDDPGVKRFPLAVRTGGPWPLLLVPAPDGLQIWRHGQEWRRVQTLPEALETRTWFLVDNPGYNKKKELSLTLSDLNGDRREDLMVLRDHLDGAQQYLAWLQTPGGEFVSEPKLTYEDAAEEESWFCRLDINGDGKLDLIRNTWLNEPWFLAGTRSGKVLVRVYYSDAQGRLPPEPQQVFRKNDWIPSVPVVDVDGDGHPDLVLGHSRFDSREGVRKMMIAKKLDFNLTVHCFRPGTGFPRDPDCQRDIVIHLDQPSLLLSFSRRRYYEGLVSLAGDFNGDGRADLLVRDRGDQVSAYCFESRERGFHAEPDLQFGLSGPVDSFQPQDLNGDGISDLVLWSRDRKVFRLYVSQKDAP